MNEKQSIVPGLTQKEFETVAIKAAEDGAKEQQNTLKKAEQLTQSEKDLKRMQKKIDHGFRIIQCPKCGASVRGSWLEKIISCGRKKCGYFDPEEYTQTPLGQLKKVVKENKKIIDKANDKSKHS